MGHVVQLHHPVGHHEGMVIGQANHASAQFDVLRAVSGYGHEHFRR